MFDNLRELSEEPLYEDEQNDLYQDADAGLVDEPVASAAAPAKRRRSKKSKKLLGMTAQQRFLVAVMFMFAVSIMGTLALFVTGRMSLF